MKTLLYPPQMTFWQALQMGLVPSVRSETYLAWVRSLPSVLSGKQDCIAHHLVGHGLKGKNEKVSDLMTFPLTEAEHTRSSGALHVVGSTQWEQEHDDQRIYVFQTLIEAIHRGVLKVGRG